MNTNDRRKTTFITYKGGFAFKMMSFRLVNAGATFQKTPDTIFASQIGRNMQVNVDDVIIKSKRVKGHIDNLKENFFIVGKQHEIKPNKVFLWCCIRQILRLFAHSERD